MIESFHGEDFIGSCSSVESLEQRLEHGVFTFNVDVHQLEPENPRNIGGFHDPVEIEGGHTEVQNEETTPEGQEHLSGHGEVFEMGRNLFGTNEVVESFSDLNSGEVQGMVVAVVRVFVGLGQGLLHGTLVFLFKSLNLVLESRN